MMLGFEYSVGLDDFLSAFRKIYIAKVMAEQDIKMHYKRSKIGPFWITISMAVLVSVMGFVFSNVLKTNLREFLPYLAIGLIIWSFFQNSVLEGCDVLISSESLIKQLPIPLHIHIMRVIWKNLIIFFHNIIIFPFILIIVGKKISLSIFLVIPGIVLLVFNLNCLLVCLSIICARFRDMSQIVFSFMQVVFYLTPIIWMPNLLSNRAGEWFLKFNPVYHFIDLVRIPLLGETPRMSSYVFGIVMGFFGLCFSLFMTGKYKHRIPYWV